MKFRSFILVLFIFQNVIFAKNINNPLIDCWKNQVELIKNDYLYFSYSEKLHELNHNFKPWETTDYNGFGNIWMNINQFKKVDTIQNSNRKYFSRTDFNSQVLLFQDYGDKSLSKVSNSQFLAMTYNSAKYNPMVLINYFYDKKIQPDSINKEFAIYKTTINQSIVRLYISNKEKTLTQVSILNDDALFGDVLTTFKYSNYVKINQLNIPKNISIEKYNGKIIDVVEILTSQITSENPIILEYPKDYKMTDNESIKSSIEHIKYSDHIQLLELKHTDDRVLLVEFADFLLIAEAPLNSQNGDLIISEAKKIAPNKPIKYFVFGHFHEHYLGGVRPFVHDGAIIICSSFNKDYLQYLVDSKHSLNPDKLEMEPKPLVTKLINDSLSIKDDNFEMKIYFIGKQSDHTIDYLIYYFPSEKVVFQDDLAWIAKEGPIKKARSRQAGLYNAIKNLKLDVKTILQSWPVADYGVKTIIPFDDLEKSMKD